MNKRIKKKLVKRYGYMKYRNKYKFTTPKEQLVLSAKHLLAEAESEIVFSETNPNLLVDSLRMGVIK